MKHHWPSWSTVDLQEPLSNIINYHKTFFSMISHHAWSLNIISHHPHHEICFTIKIIMRPHLRPLACDTIPHLKVLGSIMNICQPSLWRMDHHEAPQSIVYYHQNVKHNYRKHHEPLRNRQTKHSKTSSNIVTNHEPSIPSWIMINQD